MLVAGLRTPIGTAGHGLAELSVTDLAAPLLAELARRTASLDRTVDDVILGNCMGPGGNPARVAALAAGIGARSAGQPGVGVPGVGVPGVTVDRQCGSGLDAVLQAASRIRAGDADLVLAGGVESASTAPWRCWPPGAPGANGIPSTEPVRYARAPFAPPGFPDPEMGVAADDLAQRLGISRERQDAYAARSHEAAHRAAADGVFRGELLPVGGLSADERPRPGMTPVRLGRLRPAFTTGGTATAGNSCGVSDGAAVLTVTTAGLAADAGLPGLRILAAAATAGDPALPGLAAAPAIRKVLARTGIGIEAIGAVEITEAFASVALAVIDKLGMDPAVVCSDGGAIGLGHPWGASGAILLVRLFARMVRPGGSALGLAACAIGGGQGLAMLVERT